MITITNIAQAYFDAWNAHNAQTIVDLFTANGFYHDPIGHFTGTAIGAYAQGLWDAFPNLSFEITSIAETNSETVAAEWVMTGTNTGSFMGLPPTGKTISLEGADFIKLQGDKIHSVTGYFDSRVIPDQLGLNVLVQPNQLGSFTFGNSVFAQTGKKTKPGAFSITSIWSSDQGSEQIRNLSRDTASEMMKMDGVIGVAMARAGNRGITISAWESKDDIRQIMQSPAHNEAMKQFWDKLGDAAYTSVWTPHRINTLWVRCSACSKVNDYEKNEGLCLCGADLAEPPAYF